MGNGNHILRERVTKEPNKEEEEKREKILSIYG